MAINRKIPKNPDRNHDRGRRLAGLAAAVILCGITLALGLP